MNTVLRVILCLLGGLLLGVSALTLLMVLGRFDAIQAWLDSGRPLASLLLWLLPDGLWDGLTGIAHARRHPAVVSFLGFCMALLQVALLSGWLLFRGSRRR